MSSLIKVAIIGGGPSAFYVASRLLQLLPQSNALGSSLRIHIYDRLWAPHGLVRYGVAPDHPEVKNCTHKFDIAAKDSRLRFFGNVNIGEAFSSIPHSLSLDVKSLYSHYTHVLMSSGCTVPRLDETLPISDICQPALSLVHWYTQHPTLPKPPPLEKTKHVTIFGHGNVSLDVARILLMEPDELAKYDVPESVLEQLRRSAVEHVSIIGRRGPMEASFTTKELREMMNLSTASMEPLDRNITSPLPDVTLTRQQDRLLTLMREGSKNQFGSTKKTWSLLFYTAPAGLERFSPFEFGTRSVKLTLSHTMLDRDKRAIPTGIKSNLETDFVVQSLGYRAEPSQEWYDPALGYLKNIAGRIIDASGRTLERVYASGWASTGAKGVLASTLMNAHAVADTIISDMLPKDETVMTGAVEPQSTLAGSEVVRLLNPDPNPDDPPSEVANGIKSGLVFEYKDWKIIDEEEVRRGQEVGKERERMRWDEMRKFVDEWRSKNPFN